MSLRIRRQRGQCDDQSLPLIALGAPFHAYAFSIRRPSKPHSARKVIAIAYAMKSARTTVIQAAPIALRREEASQALGISVSLFESLVRRGRMPKPRMLADKSVGWLYAELQRFAEALPVSDLPPGPGRRRPTTNTSPRVKPLAAPGAPVPDSDE